MLYREGIKVSLIDRLTGLYPTHESLMINVTVNSFKANIICIYRPPALAKKAFIKYLKDSRLLKRFKKLIILGDLNMNTLDTGNSQILTFDQLLRDNGFENTVELPKFFSYRGVGSLLDHVWSNLNIKYESFVVESPLADHLPVMTIFDVRDPKREIHTIRFRDYSTASVQRCMSAIQREKELFLRDYVNIDGTEAKAKFLSEFFMKMLDKYFPIKVKKVSGNTLMYPWISEDIKKCIDKKHKLFRLFVNGDLPYAIFSAYDTL